MDLNSRHYAERLLFLEEKIFEMMPEKEIDKMTVYELRKKLENIANQNKKIVVWEDERSLESDSDQNIEV